MKRSTNLTLALVVVGSLTLAQGPSSPTGSALSPIAGPVSAQAQVTKSRGSGGAGGGNVSGVGDRLGGLLSGWGVPLTIVIGGFLMLAAFGSRNMGAAIGIAAAVIVVLIFFLDPAAIEKTAKEISSTVF